MNAPTMNPDGSCPDCIGGWLCKYHQAEGVERWNRKQAVLREVAAGIRLARLAEICARYELESDEFYTAMQKAEAIRDGR